MVVDGELGARVVHECALERDPGHLGAVDVAVPPVPVSIGQELTGNGKVVRVLGVERGGTYLCVENMAMSPRLFSPAAHILLAFRALLTPAFDGAMNRTCISGHCFLT